MKPREEVSEECAGKGVVRELAVGGVEWGRRGRALRDHVSEGGVSEAHNNLIKACRRVQRGSVWG